MGGVLGDASEHIGEPGLRIDVVQLASDNETIHGSGALAAPIGASEQP